MVGLERESWGTIYRILYETDIKIVPSVKSNGHPAWYYKRKAKDIEGKLRAIKQILLEKIKGIAKDEELTIRTFLLLGQHFYEVKKEMKRYGVDETSFLQIYSSILRKAEQELEGEIGETNVFKNMADKLEVDLGVRNDSIQ